MVHGQQYRPKRTNSNCFSIVANLSESIYPYCRIIFATNYAMKNEYLRSKLFCYCLYLEYLFYY